MEFDTFHSHKLRVACFLANNLFFFILRWNVQLLNWCSEGAARCLFTILPLVAAVVVAVVVALVINTSHLLVQSRPQPSSDTATDMTTTTT